MMYKAYPAGISSMDERLPGIINRLKNGASLISESQKLGYSNNVALRAALRAKLGKEIYEKLVPVDGWMTGGSLGSRT